MRAGFLITARLKSTRLPKKLVLKIQGEEIISLMIRRLQIATGIAGIVIATSDNPQDEELCTLARREHASCFQGSELNVIERLYEAGRKFQFDYVLNITGDCPLVSYDFIDDFIGHYQKTNADLITAYTLPHGFFMYGLKMEALKRILELTADEDTAAWGRFFTPENGFTVSDLPVSSRYCRKKFRLTLDYPEDYAFFTALFEKMGSDTYTRSTMEIITFLDAHPEIVSINQECGERYQKQFQKEYNFNPYHLNEDKKPEKI
jgi:spore coat polysaccharide biosynthesis protein SpsF